jgi:hypothetical protein
MQQIGALAAQRERIETLFGRAELRRDAETESRQRCDARRERRARVVVGRR